jgi:hypothetical protein
MLFGENESEGVLLEVLVVLGGPEWVDWGVVVLPQFSTDSFLFLYWLRGEVYIARTHICD